MLNHHAALPSKEEAQATDAVPGMRHRHALAPYPGRARIMVDVPVRSYHDDWLVKVLRVALDLVLQLPASLNADQST